MRGGSRSDRINRPLENFFQCGKGTIFWSRDDCDAGSADGSEFRHEAPFTNSEVDVAKDEVIEEAGNESGDEDVTRR